MTLTSLPEGIKIDPMFKSLLFPWLSVAVVAIGSAGINMMLSQTDENDSAQSMTRDLQEPDRVYHEHLFPLVESDIWGFVLAVMGLMVAAGGGVGGGGILVPIYSLVMRFSVKHAIILSNITVLGGALANTILNTPKRHPFADRPLVDWNLILVMEPLTIAGALIGAFLNKVLPDTLLLVLLVTLLSFTGFTSLKKGYKLYLKENAAMEKKKPLSCSANPSESTKLVTNPQKGYSNVQKCNTEATEADDDLEAMPLVKNVVVELQEILEYERKAPLINIITLVSTFLVVLVINVLKGGGSSPSPLGIQCGSISFWVANGTMIGWTILISVFVRAYLVRQFEQKERVNYQYVEGDIQWDAHATALYPCVCSLAGFFAGMFGIGGGIVKGPLMLAMGVHPAVSSATSACMILFTSFTATSSYAIFGLLVKDYTSVCFCIGFVATIAGQLGFTYLMRNNERNSYIAFSIASVVLLSAVLMGFQSLLRLTDGTHHTHSGGICEAEL